MATKLKLDQGRNHTKAIEFTERVVAVALQQTCNTPLAIETQKCAISLIPDGAENSTREELESNLRTFEEALDLAQDGK